MSAILDLSHPVSLLRKFTLSPTRKQYRNFATVTPYGDFTSKLTYYTLLDIENELAVRLPDLDLPEAELLYNKLLMDVAKAIYGNMAASYVPSPFTTHNYVIDEDLRKIKAFSPVLRILDIGSENRYRLTYQTSHLPFFKKK